jgi:Glyoxalase/Bleomycin resistance protein/Dioxygenase superfamily
MSILSRGTTIVQNAYVVNDLKEACRTFNQIYGAGPFLVLENFKQDNVVYRGNTVQLTLSIAMCQMGELNIEFIQQLSKGPSCYRDTYAEGEEGYHHVAVYCKDYETEKSRFEEQGFPVVQQMMMGEDAEICYVDTRKATGYMLELYPEGPEVRGLYELVKQASENWDGKTLFQPLTL